MKLRHLELNVLLRPGILIERQVHWFSIIVFFPHPPQPELPSLKHCTESQLEGYIMKQITGFSFCFKKHSTKFLMNKYAEPSILLLSSASLAEILHLSFFVWVFCLVFCTSRWTLLNAAILFVVHNSSREANQAEDEGKQREESKSGGKNCTLWAECS